LKGPECKLPYKLVVNAEMENPLVKERNFQLKVKLVDADGNIMKNSNKIYLEISIYTADIPPLQIKTNTQGSSILKGGADRPLIDGEATFPKLQVKEVSSHYRTGRIFIAVYPCQENFSSVLKKDKNFVDHDQIEPLIISDVVVKAKIQKTIQRKRGGDNRGQIIQEQVSYVEN